ncbi:hypothetical protein [Ponticaulis sp.]|uniref:hypothetical protein n=1 Tax=Ponticaulis sp. TaxID=2020902 RepID=UPI0025DBDC71|nr:hypothetical protein [Ponticaulis sp.]|tara:strand:- start:6713 stop:6928 length:216 start_codon:yes stop_codon:yes gene_type:complete
MSEKMARPEGVSSNSPAPSLSEFLNSDAIFEELKEWEDQLRDIDLSVLEYDDPKSDDSSFEQSEHGGPSPC